MSTSSIDRPVAVIRPPAGWPSLNLREVWQFRDLLFTLAGRDLKLRYRQTLLGVVWVILQPLFAAGVFTMVFGKVAKMPSDGVPYFIFAFTGMLGWNLFSGTLSKVNSSMVGNAHLISKVAFPRLVLPLSTLFTGLIDFAVALAALAVLMMTNGITPGPGLLLLPVCLMLILLLALGMGLFASALMVRYRDVGHLLPLITQFLMYATPVVYAASAVPEWLRPYYYLNPLASVVEAFRWSLLNTPPPQWDYLGQAAAMALLVFLIGAYTFKKMEQRFADII